MYTLFVTLHVVVCVVLCVVVLLQSSKGSGLAGAFGGGGGLPQQIFGTRGMTTLLTKLTIGLAAGFFVTSTVLFMLSTPNRGTGHSIVQEHARGAASQPVPIAPAGAPAPKPAGR